MPQWPGTLSQRLAGGPVRHGRIDLPMRQRQTKRKSGATAPAAAAGTSRCAAALPQAQGGTRQRRLCREQITRSPTLGKVFTECKSSFAECRRHSAKSLDPVVIVYPPLSAAFPRVMTVGNERSIVLAATVMTHGADSQRSEDSDPHSRQRTRG